MRYNRQEVLPQIGSPGQERLKRARVLLVGCGALGSVAAELLARSGIGFLRIVDRDLVELSNLQRQILFDQRDAAEGLPKAIAAARRLREINDEVQVDAIVADVNPANIESLADVDLIVDGTDNVSTRYLINDLAVRSRIPWIYGGCVGVEGRVWGIWPACGAYFLSRRARTNCRPAISPACWVRRPRLWEDFRRRWRYGLSSKATLPLRNRRVSLRSMPGRVSFIH
jgi:molybdopterin/thiamine biosynthesis adenylyltransferase